ncbi:MAG: UDP-3-O-(3-hydroxymyristoyl)glucosamine N-acyltransferase [Gammaproteobacteria bacterium RIFCSPLOWO2_12_FULL_38_14]|nr:MAG: UDP-3-O-(3-hydroxymyristoyl)glucosamine N-acyltransferase [Gammaproteobacteria bacterium RIFCSPLOWO2_12_FULL_38_14]
MICRLEEISQKLGLPLQGDGNCLISTIAPLATAKPGAISFCDKGKYRNHLKKTQASAVILSVEDVALCPTNALIAEHPYLAFAKALELFSSEKPRAPHIHPTAIIEKNCIIPNTVYIGPYVVIEEGCVLGEHVVLLAHTYLGHHCQIGSHTRLEARVTLYPEVTVGEHCILHSGVVVGSDGFGYTPHKEGWQKIPQIGTVIIGNYVEIGANTTIDRGTLEATVIGNHVKLDNLIQIAHNVRIGDNTAIAACVGISGSTTIGKNCMIAGATGIGGHLEITDNVTITGMTMVTKSITKPGIYSSGTGMFHNKEWKRLVARLRHLGELALKVKILETQAKSEALDE